MRFVGSYDWSAPGVGGLSAIALNGDGQTGRVVTDRGTLFDIEIRRRASLVHGIEITATHSLTYEGGHRSQTYKTDSEGIALRPDGGVIISFEQVQEIREYDLARGTVAQIKTPEQFTTFGRNSGLEAIALTQDGQLLTLPERPQSKRQGFALWRLQGQNWTRIAYLPSRNGFLAVAADVGPDGLFYLLERRVTVLGFQSRLRRWTMGQDTMGQEETLLTTRAGRFGNLEGLSLWQSPSGQTIATMVADNNFWPVMRTQIVEYALAE